MKNEFKSLESHAKAIVALLHPFAEVVIHDLKTKKIAGLYNNFSKRSVGDASLLEEELKPETLPDYFGPYTKINYNGRKLKSMSTTIRNESGKATGLFCINLDVEDFESAAKLILNFTSLQDLSPRPKELFVDDWKEKLNIYVNKYLESNSLNRNHLNREQIKKLLLHLKEKKALKVKNAAAHIAAILNISKATVYNYLKEI